jgi:hypothetical protein
VASDDEIADGIDKLITLLSPSGAWVAPGRSGKGNGLCISDALFSIFPGGYVPLRGAIGEYLSSHITEDHFCKTSTYFWENGTDRTQNEVVALLNRAFEGIMK